jgi:hypothetical protein
MSTIEWLKVRLVEEGFGFRYISGSMPLKQRAKVCCAATPCLSGTLHGRQAPPALKHSTF